MSINIWFRIICVKSSSHQGNTGVVPKTTPPLIWPSNGKIIRGPYQIFFNPTLMEGFDYVNMTNCSNLLLPVIEYLKLCCLLSMLWLWWLPTGIIFSFLDIISYFVVEFNFYWIPFDGMFMIDLFWVSTYPSEVFQLVSYWLPLFTLPMTLSP